MSDEVVPVLVQSVATFKGHPASPEVRDPAGALKALEMLASGATYVEVSKITGFSANQLAALRTRHEIPLQERRKALAADALELTELLRAAQKVKLEELLSDPKAMKKVNIRDLTLPWSMAQRGVFEALGETRTIVEHRTGGASIEDAQKAIEEARRALREQAVEVVVTPTKEKQ